MADAGNIVRPESSSSTTSILQEHLENLEHFDPMIQNRFRRYLEGALRKKVFCDIQKIFGEFPAICFGNFPSHLWKGLVTGVCSSFDV